MQGGKATKFDTYLINTKKLRTGIFFDEKFV